MWFAPHREAVKGRGAMNTIEEIRASSLSEPMKAHLTARENLMRVGQIAGWSPEASEALAQALDVARQRLGTPLNEAANTSFHITQSIARGYMNRDAIRAFVDTCGDRLLNDVFGQQAVRAGWLPADQAAMMRLALALTEFFAAP